MAVASRLGPGVSSSGEPEDGRRLDSRLSRREWQVLQELSKGATNWEIAASLAVSVHTVKGYVKAILLKLNAKNRTAAAIWFERLRNHLPPSSALGVASFALADGFPQMSP